MDFRILGPVEVVGEEGPVRLPRGRARALLALLVLRAGETVSTDRLIHDLWGADPPPTATTALHGLVSTLRKRLNGSDQPGTGLSVLETRPPGYLLSIDPEQVDANRFRRLLDEALDAPPVPRAAGLREALGLWRGAALADVAYEPFAQAAITGLEELRLTAVEELVDADLALGRHTDVLADLEMLTAEHPLRERLVGQLMLALYRCGRQADALDVYAAARRRLGTELGLDPGPALQRLEQAILRQDPSLEPPATAVDTAPGLHGGARWLPEERRTVTVAFVELTGSSGAVGTSDPEPLQRAVRRGLETTREIVARHGGTVQGFLGGVAVAVFGVPTTHEDDALRAVRAAVDLRDALADLNDGLRREHGSAVGARVGIDTGEVIVGGPDPSGASGHAITIAARLQQAALEGEILVGESTRRLAGHGVLLEPVDRPVVANEGQAIAAWKLLDVLPADAARPATYTVPMVGRGRELARLDTGLARAVREQHGHLLTVVGEAGVGKSRLAQEFTATMRGKALVLTGRCLAYGEGITFWPLREVVEQAAGGTGPEAVAALLGDGDRGRSAAADVAAAVGAGVAPSVDLFPAVRHFFEELGSSCPVVVVLDDVHWGQPTLLDLVEYLTASVAAPLLTVCLARPEFLEQRPTWGHDRDRTSSIRLEPLSAEHSRELIHKRLAGQPLPHAALERVMATAQGNPLFVEQILASLRHDREPSVPATVQALLAARLDRLGPAERDLLRCASVAGVDVRVATLRALVPEAAAPFIERHLEALENKELIHPIRRSDGEPTLTFRHVLIQLAAYRSITRQARSELHERVADWYAQETDGAEAERDALVGYHLEQAHDQRRQLGMVDEHTRDLAIRAGERLGEAGMRAYARFDVAAAENLLSRARALLPTGHPQRWQVSQPLPEVHQVLGQHRAADRVLGELLEAADAEGDELRAARIRLERSRIRLVTGRDAEGPEAVRAEAERAREVFDRRGDDAGIAQHCFVLGLVHLRRGELREVEALARRGLVHAQRGRQPRDEAANRWWIALALVDGVAPVSECLRECEELVRTRGGGLHPGVLSELARLRAMLGEFEAARELLAHGRTLVLERVRGRRPLMFLAQRRAEMELMAGDDMAAEEQLRAALDLARDMVEPDWVAQIAAQLSILLSQCAGGEAASLATLAEEEAPADSVAAQALAMAAAALVATGDGDHARAARLAAQALDVVPEEMLNLRARRHLGLAEALLASDRRREADASLQAATDLYRRKGNLVGERRTRELIREASVR